MRSRGQLGGRPSEHREWRGRQVRSTTIGPIVLEVVRQNCVIRFRNHRERSAVYQAFELQAFQEIEVPFSESLNNLAKCINPAGSDQLSCIDFVGRVPMFLITLQLVAVIQRSSPGQFLCNDFEAGSLIIRQEYLSRQLIECVCESRFKMLPCTCDQPGPPLLRQATLLAQELCTRSCLHRRLV